VTCGKVRVHPDETFPTPPEIHTDAVCPMATVGHKATFPEFPKRSGVPQLRTFPSTIFTQYEGSLRLCQATHWDLIYTVVAMEFPAAAERTWTLDGGVLVSSPY
jgi:hypothetical protein